MLYDEPDITQYLFKVLVVGDLGTGKTSIIKRYVHNIFSQNYKSTIGVDFALKVVPWSPDTVVRLQLWDIAGQERFGSMTRVYYKEAVGALVVFDVNRQSSFEGVMKWKRDLDDKLVFSNGKQLPVVLLANKVDDGKMKPILGVSSLDDFCQENGFAAWFPTSAKENINIDEAARVLVEHILDNESTSPINSGTSDSRGGGFHLTGQQVSSQAGGGTCC